MKLGYSVGHGRAHNSFANFQIMDINRKQSDIFKGPISISVLVQRDWIQGDWALVEVGALSSNIIHWVYQLSPSLCLA